MQDLVDHSTILSLASCWLRDFPECCLNKHLQKCPCPQQLLYLCLLALLMQCDFPGKTTAVVVEDEGEDLDLLSDSEDDV